MSLEDLEHSPEVEHLRLQTEELLAEDGLAAPPVMVHLEIGDTQASTLMTQCVQAFRSFQGSQAGFVAAPDAAWSALEMVARALGALPPRTDLAVDVPAGDPAADEARFEALLAGPSAPVAGLDAEDHALMARLDSDALSEEEILAEIARIDAVLGEARQPHAELPSETEGATGLAGAVRVDSMEGGSSTYTLRAEVAPGDIQVVCLDMEGMGLARALWLGEGVADPTNGFLVSRTAEGFSVNVPTVGTTAQRFRVTPMGTSEEVTVERLLERGDLSPKEMISTLGRGDYEEPPPDPDEPAGVDPAEEETRAAEVEQGDANFRKVAMGLAVALPMVVRALRNSRLKTKPKGAQKPAAAAGGVAARPCASCGATIRPGLRFCTECGKPAPDENAGPDERKGDSQNAPQPLDRRVRLQPDDIPTRVAERCGKCNAELTPGKAFCTDCGAPVNEPEPPQDHPRQCPHCGSESETGKKFCGDCGGAMDEQPAPPAPEPEDALSASSSLRIEQPSSCGQCGTEFRPGKKFCIKCGAAVPEGSAPQVRVAEERVFGPPSAPPPPPDPHRGQRAFQQEAAGAAAGAGQPGPAGYQPAGEPEQPPPLPAQQPPWEFQRQTTDAAQQVVSSLGAKGMIARMIRGALLDANVYRETAADPKLQSEAWGVMLIAIVLSSAGFLLLSLSPGALMSILSICIVQAIAWLARVWIIQFIAEKWLGSRASFEQLFRPLAYAQTPACLQIVPIVGQLSRVWSLVTSTAAIRDVTGADTVKAAVLALAGEVGVGIAAGFAGNLLRGFF